MPENLESKQYTLEEAENEAELLKKKVDSGKAEDYKDAEEKTEEEYFKMLMDARELDAKNLSVNEVRASQWREILNNTPESKHKSLALKLIESGQGKYVTYYINDFKNLDQEVALKLIDARMSYYVIHNIGNFKNLNELVALKIFNEGTAKRDALFDVLDKFPDSVQSTILLKYIDRPITASRIVNRELYRFHNLDKHVLIKLMDLGKYENYEDELISKLDRFKGLDNEVALKFIEMPTSYGIRQLCRVLDKFHGLLDKTIALKLINNNKHILVWENFDKFQGISDDKEMQLSLITSRNLPAIEIMQNSDRFTKITHKEIALRLLDTYGESNDFVDKNITIFSFADDAFLDSVEKLNLKPSEFLLSEGIIGEKDELNESDFKKIYENLGTADARWKDEQNITGPFEQGAEYFGYQKMFEYLNRDGLSRHDGLHNFRRICEVAQSSGLPPQEFYNNILNQAQKDDSVYGQGTAHHKLNNLVDSINLDFEEIIKDGRQYPNIKKLQELLGDLDSPKKIFESWKNLKKYEEICELLQRKEILDQLQSLKKEGKEKLYAYVETLAFHPNISMEKVMEFWKEPERFLEIMDTHTPREVQNRKKPSNYVEFPHLDLTAEELVDALVEGDYDKLQVFKPMEIEYRIAESGTGKQKTNLPELIYQAVGKRSEGIAGEAKDPKKTFGKLTKLFKTRGIKLVDFLKSADIEKEFPKVSEFRNEIDEILMNEQFGMKSAKKETEQYRAKINLKSDPDGVVAGNDTACCMPFGSGKNNVYTFNPICSLFTVQRKTAEGQWRTVAQSVLTKNKDIKQNISELRDKLENTGVKMHEVVNEEILRGKKGVIVCDNIEVAQNFKSHSRMEETIKTIYTDFFQEYLQRFGDEDNLEKNKIPVGKGYTDALTGLPEIENTFIPEAPVGYSDNLHEKAYLLDIQKGKISKEMIAGKKISIQEIKKIKQDEIKLSKGVSYLTFQDTLPVAYIEGKAYKENESLMEYLHNMENALIAKDVNNTAKDRPNMSLKYADDKGKVRGYVLTYEGKLGPGYYDQENDESSMDDEPVIYISDLASDGNPRAGGSLILGFVETYKRNYIDKDNHMPILAQLREQTSYQIIVKQLEKLTKDTGMKFEMEEIGTYKVGNDTMHEVFIYPE